jgi:hypothetical protein
MNNIIEIIVPFENVNDDSVVVSEFLVEDMSPVSVDTDLKPSIHRRKVLYSG